MVEALHQHWPEYLIEGTLLGLFMISACMAVFAIQHPTSPIRRRITSAAARRAIIGGLMGVTAVALIYSPWGQRSGAHMNPGTTLTFLALGKVKAWDAVFYIAAQFVGGLTGVWVSAAVLGPAIQHETVNYVVTGPGRGGAGAAWAGEFTAALSMMVIVLVASNHAVTAPYTGFFAGALLALAITIEAPLSGTSINPARTLGSALPARSFRGLWVYFTAPPLAMLCGAGLYVLFTGPGQVYCAKLNHLGDARCIFNCQIDRMPGWSMSPSLAHGIQHDVSDQHR
jgi:aquaporin Z